MTRTSLPRRRVKERIADRPEVPYRKLIDSLPDAILVIAEGSPTYGLTNTVAHRLLGYGRDELLALGPSDVSASEALPRVAAIMRTVRERGRWRGEWQLRRKHGVVIPTEATVTRLVLDGRVMYQGLFRDVGERRRADEAQRFLAEAGARLAASLLPQCCPMLSTVPRRRSA
jgi:PAS domain S-box-containing protein